MKFERTVLTMRLSCTKNSGLCRHLAGVLSAFLILRGGCVKSLAISEGYRFNHLVWFFGGLFKGGGDGRQGSQEGPLSRKVNCGLTAKPLSTNAESAARLFLRVLLQSPA